MIEVRCPLPETMATWIVRTIAETKNKSRFCWEIAAIMPDYFLSI
jgi:hypothetical protein